MDQFDFDIDYLNECMEAFELTCPSYDEYSNKLGEISMIYKQSIDDIVDELISILQNDGRREVSMEDIVLLEKKFEKKLKDSELSKSARRNNQRKPLSDKTLCLQADNEAEQKEAKPIHSTDKIDDYISFSPYSKSPMNQPFFNRRNSGKQSALFSGDKFKIPTSIQNMRHTIVSKPPRDTYGGDKASLVIQEKARWFAQIADEYKSAYDEISAWGNPLQDPVYTYGQVINLDAKESDKLSETNIGLMIDDEDGSVIHVDLRNASQEVSLFPGQFIAVKGVNENGSQLLVEKIFDAPRTPPPAVVETVAGHIWLAAGPFTATSNCAFEHLHELLREVVKHQPSYLILCGPFVDRRNQFIRSEQFTITDEALMEALLDKICTFLQGTKTKVLAQMSGAKDAAALPVFPTVAFETNQAHVSKRMEFIPDPCVLRIGSIEIAITCSEIIYHLTKHEYSRLSNTKAESPFHRLFRHLSRQRSLYPLEPADIPSSRQDILEVCRLTSTPHIIVAPFVLNTFVKDVDGTICINPSSLAKGGIGTFAKVQINAPTGSNLAENCQVEVVWI